MFIVIPRTVVFKVWYRLWGSQNPFRKSVSLHFPVIYVYELGFSS